MTTIPPITDPMGRHWNQPSRDHILVDDTHAVMAKDTIFCLLEYSSSNPSGVYPGKMWKAQTRDGVWMLSWYGGCEDPALCSINRRPVLLV